MIKEDLERLKALQDLQNSQTLESRVRELEETVDSMSSTILEIKKSISNIQAEFYRDHNLLSDSIK